MTPRAAKHLDDLIMRRLRSFGRAPTAVVRSLVCTQRPRNIELPTHDQVHRRLVALAKAGKVRRVELPIRCRQHRWEVV